MVGDARFFERCKNELFEKRADRALILVSHDMSFIQEVCDTAAVLSNSSLQICATVADAINLYHRL